MKMPKYDNQAVDNAKALGTFIKETVRTAGLKMQIRQRKATNEALQRMNRGEGNTYRDSAGMGDATSKKKER